MAMFAFVIDTPLMNVSISAVVRDLDTAVSGVRSAVAIEALVSAAFILIGSKLGDLFGRRRDRRLRRLAVPAGDASLIHGNFEGRAQAKAYALAGPPPRSPPQ